MYVTNGSLSSGTVSVIDGQTNTVIGNPVQVGDDPVGIAFNANNGNMYVTNQTPNTVTVIDGQTNTVIANPIPVGGGPLGIAFNANNGNMYTANSASNTVSVISTSPIPSPFIDTAITSAVDGNNSPVANNTGSTVSNKITFTFTGTGNNNNNIAGFQCGLDAPAFSSCTTPKTYENLGIGDHTFNVRAVDLLGNKDTTPASFSWKVLTPAQGIQKLIDDINNNPSIAKRVKVVLTGRLQAAITLLTDNNPKNDVAVCALMDSFTKIVNIYNKNGLLTLFQASQLNQQAIAIKNSLGCSVMTGFSAVYPIIPIGLTRNG
jgi:YVTN family beta-propeller protein